MNNSTIADWWQVGLTFASVVIALATFWLAWKVQKAVASNHAKQKQVEVMSKLVEKLNKTKIKLVFRESTETVNVGTVPGVFLNVFELALLNESDDDEINWKSFDDCVVYLSERQSVLDFIGDFVDNPFVPDTIANELLHFYVSKPKEKEMIHGRFVILGDETDEVVNFHNCYETKSDAFKNWNSLKTHSERLTDTVRKWFKQNHIGNCNIRMDYKNNI